MPTWLRYLLFQIPGWVIAAIVLFALWRWQFFSLWLAVFCFLGWLVKDLMLYPLTRIAYETRHKEGSKALIGETAVSEGDLLPEGYVRVRGELWRAVADPSGGTIPAGTKVEIFAAQGMKVFVRATDKSETARVQTGG